MIKEIVIENNSNILKNESLKKHTTFGIGGNAKYLVFPKNIKEIISAIKFAKQNNLETFFFGSGSNLLIDDNGYNGMIISLKKTFKKIIFSKNKILVESGVMLGNMVKLAIKRNITGFESMIGVPGTVGGAIIMNAGAHGTEISEKLISIRTLNYDGKIKTYLKNNLLFSYRHSNIPLNEILIDALFQSSMGDSKEINSNKAEVSKNRKETQPLRFRSAGSIFKNPTNKIAAGKLIDEAGLKGLRIGDAEISKKHANFIINHGNAKSSDVIRLINIIKSEINKKYNIELKLEIKLLGIDFNE